jgi:hypothetical protein
VRLVLLWSHAGVHAAEPRIELPWALAPGEETVVDVPFAAQSLDRKPLPPGRYEVRVGLVQELVAWFADAGDPGEMRLEVEVR